MEYAIAKVSSKGQIVIPSAMRKEIKQGDSFLVVKEGKNLVLKNMQNVANELKEEIEFSERIDRAWERYDRGEFKRMSKDDFLNELDKW